MTLDTISRREAVARVAYLLGGTLAAPTIAGVLAGCSGDGDGADAASTASPLQAEQKELIASIAEHIIPQTDTAGARTAGVPQFIEVMLRDYYPEAERKLFLDGLAQVDERARKAHDQPFLKCTPAQQVALLTALDREAFAPEPRVPGGQIKDVRERVQSTNDPPLPPSLESDSLRWRRGEKAEDRSQRPFFRTMKELTLVGYYTSKEGATVELRYAPSPGPYRGCIPFAEVGRTWAV